MKKCLKVIILIVCVLLPVIWWYSQAPISRGVYVERQIGLVVSEIGEHLPIFKFELPIRWVKSYPWEKAPTIGDITLLNENGEPIAVIEGKDKLEVDTRLINREARTQIELFINGKVELHSYGYTVTPIKEELKEYYLPKELKLKLNEKEIIFPLENTYKFVPIKKEEITNNDWHIYGLSYIIDGGATIFKLSGPKNAVLEEILFWLPGMPKNYFDNMKYAFTYDEDISDFNDIKWSSLSLPLDLDTNYLLLYFPLTEEIDGNYLDNASVIIRPYFKFSSEEKQQYYYSGGASSIGHLRRDKKWYENLIRSIK